MLNPICQVVRDEFERNEAVCSRALTLFHLISNKARFRIICLLTRGDFCVQEICQVVGQGHLSNISQQLKILLLAGLVERRRQNRQIIYSLKDQRLRGMIAFLQDQFLEQTSQIL